MRALLFTIWIQADKSVTGTIAILDQLTLALSRGLDQGGARMINASLSGKQFSYELPANWAALGYEDLVREAYKVITYGGASGGEMTDAELKAYVLDANNEVTDTLTARVSLFNSRY